MKIIESEDGHKVEIPETKEEAYELTLRCIRGSLYTNRHMLHSSEDIDTLIRGISARIRIPIKTIKKVLLGEAILKEILTEKKKEKKHT